MLRLMIVDDEFLVRIGIRETIDWPSHGFEIVGEAENGEEGLEMARRLKPDIIVTDIRMPNMDGLEFIARLRQDGVAAAIIILSGYDEFDYARTALNQGAMAYLLKPIENQQLLDVITKTGQKITKEREMEQHYQELERKLPDIIKAELIRMIDGVDQSPEEKDLREIDFPWDQCKVLILLKIEDYQQFIRKNADKIPLIRNVFLTLNDPAVDKRKTILLERTNNEWLIIISGENTEICRDSDAFCRGLLDLVYDRCGLTSAEVTFTIGISDAFQELAEIGRAYREAVRASDFKLIPNANSIRHAGEVPQADTQSFLARAIELIKCNYGEEITIESIAARLGISASYLMHLFKSKMGKTFGDCLSDIRVNAAKELLSDPACKVYEVAARVGYKDPRYFGQVFKRSTGLTPKEYLKSTAGRTK